MNFPPVSYRRIAANELRQLVDQESVIRLILKLESEPTDELDDRCESDSIVIDVSRPKGSVLRQSLISARGKAPATSELWKQISARLRKITKAGVTATSRSTGATAQFKAFRYTDAAKSLAESGTVMLPFAGESEMKLGQ
jgi:hypothetical protein